ncbi:hypothetical protein B0E43_17245 [Algoriphagus sp. A40]|nr:hypothetical protein B0E43_17245 [Algoriphagus sp. A40]
MLSAAILGLALFAIDASAQTETEKVEENNPKVNDRVILEDHSSIQDNSPASNLTVKPATTIKPATTVKRDLPAGGVILEKEVKRNESPSTLSFNIFLYVVDKFKAD